MSQIDKSGPQEPDNPENLYRRYLSTRERVHESQAVRGTEAVADNMLPNQTSDQDQAEFLYQTYRSTRVSNRDADIDAIVSAVQADQMVATILQHREQPDAITSPDVPDGTRTGSNMTSFFRNLFEAPMRLLDRVFGGGHSASPVWRFGLPVAATALLIAILLVPGLQSQNPSVDGALPESLLVQAEAVSPFISQDTGVTLAFSSGPGTQQAAFNRGLADTRLSIAFRAGDVQASSKTIRQIAALANVEGQEALSVSSAELLGAIEEQSFAQKSFISGINRVQVLLREVPKQNKSHGWFEQGQAVEALALAAEHARLSGDTSPLLDTLSYFQSLSSPDPELPASVKIQQMQSMSLSSPPQLDEIRQVLEVANSIKVLMQ